MSDCLSEDLIAEIFLRLPVKSLVRFKSLSKSWCCRISSPDFIRMHTLQSVKTPKKVLIRHWNRDMQDIYTLHSQDHLPVSRRHGYTGITAVELSPSDDYKIVGSCNGILCLRDYGFGVSFWNFSIRRKFTPPDHPPCKVDFSLSSREVIGFGYDPIADDYKVLTLFYHKYEEGARSSFVYTMKTGCWSAIASPTTPFFDVKAETCFVSGRLHWVAKSYLTELKTGRHDFIMTFDLSSYVFSEIPLPEASGITRRLKRQVTVIDECLAMICSEGDDTWVWMMREYNNAASWSVVLKLRTPDFHLDKVLPPTTNGDVLLKMNNWGDCYVYNPKTGVFSEIVDFRACCFDIKMETYVESLELLDKGIACGETIVPWTKKEKEEHAKDTWVTLY